MVVRLAPGTTRVDRGHMDVWQNKRPHSLVYLAGAPRNVTLGHVQADRVDAVVELKQAGLLVLREALYPGWEARVDGSLIPLQLYEETFMAVPLRKGKYTVNFRYHPDSVRTGNAISLMTLFGLLGLLGVRTYNRVAR